MKGEVINTFRDKFHYNTVYEVGAVVDFDKERMENLIARNLCRKVSDRKEEKPNPRKTDKVERKEVLDSKPKEKEETKKEVLADHGEEARDESKCEELDEKAKSEQEAAEKIAKAIDKSKKN